MNRLGILALALAVSAGGLLLTADGAREFASLMPFNPPPKWLVPVSGGVTSICVVVALLLERRREVPKDDERLTPLVRRNPQTGVREL
jgi:hypothetical protein